MRANARDCAANYKTLLCNNRIRTLILNYFKIMREEEDSYYSVRFEISTNKNITANYTVANAKKKMEITFYIEQLLPLPDKLDETARQIIPSTHVRGIPFLFFRLNI